MAHSTNVMGMRKGKHLGQPTPLSKELIKQGNRFNRTKGNTITTAKNPANSGKQGKELIKLGRNTYHV